MGFSLKGYVLEPPRLGAHNSPFTAGPNNFVPQSLLPADGSSALGFTVSTGSNIVTYSGTSLVGILTAGDTIVFTLQLGVVYTVDAVTSSTLTLDQVFSGSFPNNSVSAVSAAYSPDVGPEVEAYNTAYPSSEANPRNDYLVLVTSELAPSVGTSYPITGIQEYQSTGLIQITSPAPVVSGSTIVISGVQGIPANGTWEVTVIDPTDFVLNGSSFSGIWQTGTGTILVIQGQPGLLTTAGFGWTKNEVVQRFDYDSLHGRFTPLPGITLVQVGLISSTGGATQLTVSPPPLASLAEAPFRLSLLQTGAFGSGITVTIDLVLADADFTVPPHTNPPTVQLSLATGDINWNPADIVTYNGYQVQWQQQTFPSLGSSKGNIGTFATLPSTPGVLTSAILLNPMPAAGQSPLLRIGYLYWLTTLQVADESHFTPFPGPPSGTVEWAVDTGRLNFSATDIENNLGTSVYQDGILFAKDVTLPSKNLGPMPASPYQLGPINLPEPATGDIIFSIPLNVAKNTPYFQFPYYEVISDLTNTPNGGTVAIQQQTGIVEFASSDASAYAGNPVTVTFGDLAIDHGVSIRLFRSPVNLTGQNPSVKDVTAIYKVQNAVWASPIQATPLVILPSTPVDDSSLVVSIGQGTGTFTGPLNPVGGPNPVAGLGYLIDFDQNQLNFAQRFSNVLVQQPIPTSYAQLPNTMVLTSNIVLALETGTGTNVYTPLTPGVDCIVDGMAGLIYYTDQAGVTITQGATGTFSGTTFTDPAASFVTQNVQVGDYLVVIADTNNKAKGLYQISNVVTGTILTTDVAAPAGSGELSYQILSGIEIMADRFFQTVTLMDPTTSVERITPLGAIQNATTIAPASSATFPNLTTLSDSSANFVTDGVQPGDTITLTPKNGTTAGFSSISSGTVTVTGLSGMASSFVGQQITFSGAASGENNGTFTISSYISPTSIVISNSAGVAPDAHNGHIAWTLLQNTGTYLVQQATATTLTPTSQFTAVDPSGYIVTRRLQVQQQYIGVVRFRFGEPLGTAAGNFSTTVNVVAQDANFTNPSSLPQGTVEISQATGNVNFSSADVAAGGTVYQSRKLALGTDYQTQPQLGLFQFTTRLLTNEEALLTYTTAPPNTSPPTPPGPPTIGERATFIVRKELTAAHPTPTSTLTFNPNNHHVALNPAPKVFRGGRPQVTNTQVTINPGNPPSVSSSMTFLPDNILTNALPHGAIIGPNENVYIDYYVFEAMGGEQTLTVLNPPLLVASVTITSDTNEFFVAGDQTLVFQAGFLMIVNGANGQEVYQIGSSSYNATNLQTQVILSGTQQFQTDEQNPQIQIASGPTPLTSSPTAPSYFTMELAPFPAIARGTNNFFLPGDKTGVYATGVVVYFTDNLGSFTDFYLVSGSQYNTTTNQTQVTVTYPSFRQYQFTQQIMFRSVRPISSSPPTTVSTNFTPITIPTPEPMTVVRRVAGQVGKILQNPPDYSITGNSITFLKPLQPNEEFGIFYTGSVNLDWPGSSGGLTGPRLQATYTATIVPDNTSNGLLGQVLNANYTIFQPDNFYYRVETITNFKLEVAQEIQQAAQNQGGNNGSGPMTSNTSQPVLYNQGNESVWFPPGDYANHDLIAQAALLYFNNAVNDLEDVLHAVDGRIVGDVDGRFQYDGVLGRYIYYSYDYSVPPLYPWLPVAPTQLTIPNQIDDNLQVIPGPLPGYPQYLSYFQQAYTTGAHSRFYKTLRNLFVQNPLVTSSSPNDGDIVGTFNFGNITSANSGVMFKRAPRAQTLFDYQFGINTFFVDNTVGEGTLRPSWTVPNPPASIVGMLVVIQDEQGNYYVDENDNATVVSVSAPTQGNPGTITISGIAHTPAGPTGSPPSPPVFGPSSNSGGASVTDFDSTTNTATISLGTNGISPRSVGTNLTLSGAFYSGNNGAFPIVGVNSLLGEVYITNSGAQAGDPSNGSITWVASYLNFLPMGCTITVSPIDVCVAQQATQDADGGGSGTYGMTYRFGRDVNFDPVSGNIFYHSPHWPFNGTSFFKLPTIFIPSSEYTIPVNNGDILEMDGVGVAVTYTAPYQFPALFGGLLDDDGNQTVPIIGPTFDGEMTAAGGGPLFVESTNLNPGSTFRSATTTAPLTGTGNLDASGTTITLASGVFPSNSPLLGLFSVTRGSTAVLTSQDQRSALVPGSPITFLSQTNINYVVLSVSATEVVLTQEYTGTTAAPTNAIRYLPGKFNATKGSSTVSTLNSGSKASITGAAPNLTVSGLSGVTTDLVGQTITITGAASSANNGTFPITSVPNSTSVVITNPHGVPADANNEHISWTTPSSMVGILAARSLIGFASQPNVTYEVVTVTTAHITLTQAYVGPTAAGTTGTLALTGLFGVTHNSPTVGLTQNQGTIPAGAVIGFLTQANTTYTVEGTVLSGTFSVIRNSASIATTASQVGHVNVNDTISFGAQPNAAYQVMLVTATTITLASPYLGSSNSSTTGTIASLTPVTPYTLTLTANYTGTTTSPTTATLLAPGPAQYNLVRIVSGLNGNADSRWRRITAETSTTITVDPADAWPVPNETGFTFAVAVSQPNLVAVGTATISGTTLTDSGNPFQGGSVTMLGNTYGIMTFIANSHNTALLDTISPIPPSTTTDPAWGAIAPPTGKGAQVSLGDIVTGPGINAASTVTVVQIGPGQSIQLSEATTGGAVTGGIFFVQFTQPPVPATSPPSLTFTGNTYSQSITGNPASSSATAAVSSFASPNATITGLTGMSAEDVGGVLQLSGANSPGNNGVFPINQYISPTSVVITNPNAVAPDSSNGSIAWSSSAITSFSSPSVTLTVSDEIPVDSLTSGVVGAQITIANAANSNNNGTFVITGYSAGPPATITYSNAAAVFPDTGALTWTIPPSPTIDTIAGGTSTNFLAGLSIGDSVTGTYIAPGSTIVQITQQSPGAYALTLSKPAISNQTNTTFVVQTQAPSPPCSTTVDSLTANSYTPTQATTAGFIEAMNIGPIVVSGAGITYNPGLIPPQVTTIEEVVSTTSFTLSAPATLSTIGNSPSQYLNATQTPTLLTIYIPYTVQVGWTVVLTSGPMAGERRQIVAITGTNSLLLDQAFPSSYSGSYRIENPLNTYNGTTFQQLNSAMSTEVAAIAFSGRSAPQSPPYVWNVNSEQNALQAFFTQVFTTLSGPSSHGVISGPAPYMTLVDTTAHFIGPDPATPLVDTTNFVYVHLGSYPAQTGSTGTIATAVGNIAQFSDPTANFTAADVGLYLSISGGAVAANNGIFQIHSLISPTQVGITNPAASSAGETNNGELQWTLFTSAQAADQGVYGIGQIVDDHTIMVTTNGGPGNGFPVPGTVTYEIVSTFGISITTIQQLFSIFTSNNEFVQSTEQFQALLNATVPVLYSGSVDANTYANGLADLNPDLDNRYAVVSDRLDFISPTPSSGSGLQVTVGNSLANVDNLYAMRYAWINSRINLQTGYLILKNTAQATQIANQQAISNQLIQLLTIQNS